MPAPEFSAATCEALAQLQERMHQIGGVRRIDTQPPVSTGSPGVNALLPAGGIERGTLLECFPTLRNSSGNGLGTLAMLVAKALSADGGAVVVIDREKTFYAPAAAALGIPWPKLLVVQPRNAQDELWAIDQALRCAGVAAVCAPLAKLGAHDFRRLQLAAESSEAVGLLLRDSPWRKQPSWAHVQLAVTPLASGERKLPEFASRLVRDCKAHGKHNQGANTPRSPHRFQRYLQVDVLRIRGAKLTAAAKRAVVPIDEVTGQFCKQSVHQVSNHHATRALCSFSPVARTTADRDTA